MAYAGKSLKSYRMVFVNLVQENWIITDVSRRRNKMQTNLPNPTVNRKDRKRILGKRVRHLESLDLKKGDKRIRRLVSYKFELSIFI